MTPVFCLFLGYIGTLCEFDNDTVPILYDILGGDVCVVSNEQTCAEVHITAERFADNPLLSCKVVVSAVRNNV